MLMITKERNANVLTLKLAGALANDWASEFARCWREAASSRERLHIVVDLSEVTFVDESGREILGSIAKQGAELIASGILMKSIVEEIAEDCSLAGTR